MVYSFEKLVLFRYPVFLIIDFFVTESFTLLLLMRTRVNYNYQVLSWSIVNNNLNRISCSLKLFVWATKGGDKINEIL